MACTNCSAATAYLCQCTIEETDCITFDGHGVPRDPLVLIPKPDPDEDSLVECGPAGLGFFLPPKIVDPPSCRVFASGYQTVDSSVRTPLFFNRERHDTDSMHEVTSTSSRIRFRTPGVYVVAFAVRWQGNATGDRVIAVRLNTAEVIVTDERGAQQLDALDQSTMTTWKFETDDYIEALAGQNSGSALRINPVGNYSPEFSATYVARG